MSLSLQIDIAIRMLDIFFQSLAPFDIIMSKFFKNNKWIGARERRSIAEFIYMIFRKYEEIKFYTSKITANFGRFFVLTFLKIEQRMSDEEIFNIFSGKEKAPARLSTFEIRFLSSLNAEDKVPPKNARLNYPLWMEKYLLRALTEDRLEKEMLALNEKASVDLRINTLKSSKDEVKKILTDSGFQVEDTAFSKNGLRILNGRIGRNHTIIANGLAEIQDEGSQLISEICDAKPNNTVVDFCAGAGGKTLAIAASMNNKGRIFALDKYEYRLENAKIRFRRAGVNNVFCQEINNKWIKRHLQCADIVLVDAPCSGTGTWRRNPDMRAKFSQKDLDELLEVQEKILDTAQLLVKNGGRLVYATCSLLMEENEDQIEKFIKKFPKFTRKNIELRSVLDDRLLYSGEYLKLSPVEYKTDGFFAALLEFLE